MPELWEVQPVALSEAPVFYARGGNGRVVYRLKTYSIKQLDIYRRDVIDTFPKDPVKALGNLVRLSTSLAILGMGADALKDFILGKDFDLSDLVVDNIYKALGFNRYMMTQMGQKGPARVFFESLLPPTQAATGISRDIVDLVRGEFDLQQAESIRSVPVVGEIFYEQMGKGRSKREDKQNRGRGTNNLL